MSVCECVLSLKRNCHDLWPLALGSGLGSGLGSCFGGVGVMG